MFQRQRPIPSMHLSFQSPAVSVLRRTQWILFLVAITSFGIAVSFLRESTFFDEQSEYYEHERARQHRITQLLTADMERSGVTLTDQQIEAVRKEVAFANQLTAKRDFSWTEMLRNLEDALPPRVSIHSVRLNFQDSTIQLQGSVRTMQDLDALVTRLDQAETFSKVGLTQHNILTNAGAPRRTTEGTVAAQPNQRSADTIDFALIVTYHQPL